MLASERECWQCFESMSSEQPKSQAPGETDKPSLATIDKLVFLVSPVGYQWPASALTGFDMQRLTEIRDATKKPITELMKEAIDLLYEQTEPQRKILAEQRASTRKRVRKVVETPVPKKAPESSVGRSVTRSLFDGMLDDDGPSVNQSPFDAMRTAGQSMTVASDTAESDPSFSVPEEQ